jgi:hypothetical protein
MPNRRRHANRDDPGFVDGLSLRPIAESHGRDVNPLMIEHCGSACKKNATAVCGVFRGPRERTPEPFREETALLREEDLDAPVLRLTDTQRRRHAQIVEAATADRHIATRHAESGHTTRHGIGAPLGEPLIVGV